MENLPINVTKICRTCFQSKNELVSLFSIDINSGLSLSAMVSQVANIETFNNKEQLPSFICMDCHYKLDISYQYQLLCKESEIKLREYLTNCEKQNNTAVNEDEIQAAMQELFGNEGNEQQITNPVNPMYHSNLILPETLDETAKNDFVNIANLDLVLNDNKITKSPKKSKKNKKKPIKLKSQLDILLKTHKEKMKIENSPKNQIFKQKRKKKLTTLTEPEQCFECGKVFQYKGYLELHLRIHKKIKAYKCEVENCGKRFSQISNLNLHKRSHNGEKPFCCHICSKLFSTSSNLNVHLKIHTGIKDFNCNLCSKSFKSQAELTSHAGTHTQIKNKICKICGKSFYKTAYLNTHVNNIHNGLKRYKCDVETCGKSFSNSSNLICHKRVHSGEKPFACTICTSKFNQSSALVRHLKSHNKSGKLKLNEKEKPVVMKPIIAREIPEIVPELAKSNEIINQSFEVQSEINPSNYPEEVLPNYERNPVVQQSTQHEEHQQQPYSISHQHHLPEALHPMNLINNCNNYNPLPPHPMLPLPPHHEPQITDQVHHYNYENTGTTYLPTTPVIPYPDNSRNFSFMMGGLDFSKNSLNGEPTYIDY